MMIRRERGFTLIEIMMVIAILGILGATALPLYNTWQQRAYGSEAAIMMKQLLDAEINYFLEHDKFFPDNQTYVIYPDGSVEPTGIDVFEEIKENLNIVIPAGHPLEYYLVGANEANNEMFTVSVRSRGDTFKLFKGQTAIFASVDFLGKTTYSYVSD